MTTPRLLAAMAPLFLLGACGAQSPTSSDLEIEALSSGNSKAMVDHFDARLRALVQEEDIPSLSAAIVSADGTTAYFSYGALERGKDAAVSQDTLFQIASLSKLLTGIITNGLIRSDALDPDAPITRYLSPALGSPTTASLDRITTQQLLQHRAGVANEDCSLYAKRQEGEPWLNGYSRDELIADLKRLSVPEGSPQDFAYSSCGYAIVGLIDETVSGQPFAALLDERVTAKYGMADTIVIPDADQQARVATPYRKDDRAVRTKPSIMGMGTPGSAIYSTVRDLASLQSAQLAAYREYAANGTDSDLILSKQTGQGEREGVRFGTGVIEIDHEEGTILLHDGDADGYASLYAFAPEQNVGIVMLTGSGGDYFVETGIELLAVLMASENAAQESVGQ